MKDKEQPTKPILEHPARPQESEPKPPATLVDDPKPPEDSPALPDLPPNALAYPEYIVQDVLGFMRSCVIVPPGRDLGSCSDTIQRFQNGGTPMRLDRKEE